MTVADNIKPYPEAAKYEVWNRVKTNKVGDKISTGVGKALSEAYAAYDVLKWDQLDAQRYQKAYGTFDALHKAEVARDRAKLHFRMFVTPAIRKLEKAKAAAKDASKNVIISKERKAEAKAIAAALDEPIRVLKAIHLLDFDGAVEALKPPR